MKTLDGAKEFKRVPKNWEHMVKVSAIEDRMGGLLITFEDGKELYCQIDYDIDATVDSMAYVWETDSYYILDEYYNVAQ